MRVLALVPHLYDTAPGQRYRIEQWQPWLRQHDVQITFVPFEDRRLHQIIHQSGNINLKARLLLRALRRRFQLLQSLTEYDVVYLYREATRIGPPVIEQRLHAAGMPFVFDFDDAIYLPDVSNANKRLGWLKSPRKTETICRLASHVITGNPLLAEYAGRFNNRVSVVPSTIDMSKYTLEAQRPTTNTPVIGWSGSLTTIPHLDTLRGALQRLAKEEPFRFRFIGPIDYHLEGVEVDSVRWQSATEVDDLRPLDVGVMPLPDTPWTRGKCAMKALQYMALGIPTVCSPVGINAALIHDGENGFLAATEDEWVDKLGRLLRSSSLRAKIGQAGRATVEQEYSTTQQAPRVLEILQSVL